MDIYSEVTERIVQQLEHGVAPWIKPWVGTNSIISHATGKEYSLLNQIMLGKPGEYASFNQINKEGGKVKKGAKSRMVVFWKLLEDVDDDGNKKTIPYLKYSRVFHLDDCEGIEPKYQKQDAVRDNKPIENAQVVLDTYISREGINLQHGGVGGAFYRPSADMINLPFMKDFINSESYYDTAFHECIHSTGHEKRLNRTGITGWAHFGSEVYSKEELIAEIGGCALMHRLGIETGETFRNNVAYVQNWLSALKNDRRLLVSASTAACKAMNYLLGIKEGE